MLSDGTFPGAVELADSGGVQWVSFGGRGDNVGITRLAARRNLSAPLCCQVLVEVTSYCDRPVTCPLQLFWDEEPLGRRGQSHFRGDNADSASYADGAAKIGTVPWERLSIEIPAGGRWQQVFQTTRAEGGRLTARLDRPDCYPADNRATAVVPPCHRSQVLLEGDKNLYLEKALTANPRVALGPGDCAAGRSGATRELPSPYGRGAGGEGNPPQVRHYGDVVSPKSPHPNPLPEGEGAANRACLDSASATVRVIYGRVPKVLPAGPLLVLRPEGPCDLWQPGDAIAEPVVARQAEGLPLLKEVRLVGIRLADARKLSLRAKAEPLAQPLAWAADGSPLGYAISRAEGRVIVLSGSLEGGQWPQRTAFPILLANALDWVAFQGSRHTPCADLNGTRRVPTTSTSDIRVPQRLAGKTVASESREFPLWICLVGLAGLLLTAEWCLYHRRWTC